MKTENDPRWAAVLARDRGSDGEFYFAVTTTGVYCRPSCAARRARPENVSFHPTPEAAERAGFRPCRRCRPDQIPGARPNKYAAQIAAACRAIERTIERAETPSPLAQLALQAGLSPFHFQRLFKAATGVSPKRYALACRGRKLRDGLHRGQSVTTALYDAGYSSSGRFYAQADALLGMQPSRYRSGARTEAIRFAVGQCWLGAILVAQGARGICAILLGDDANTLTRNLQDRFPHAQLLGGDAAFEATVARVVGWIEAPGRIGEGVDLPLDIRGTAFQQRVWEALRKIPAGATASYAEIARRIGAPTATRAVAQACGANPVAVAIPCHRVVRMDGGLSGYRWGIERKRALLARELESAQGREPA